MNKLQIAKPYNIFAVIFCVCLSVMALLAIFSPVSLTGLSDNRFPRASAIAFLLTAFMPQPVALFGYYLGGGIGNARFSKLIVGLLVLSFAVLLSAFLFMIFLTLTRSNADLNHLKGFTIPLLLCILAQLFIFPVVFTIIAFTVQKVDFWKRLLPIISLILSIIIAACSAGIIVAIIKFGSNPESQTIFRGAREATIPNFLMIGSIAWALPGLVFLFAKNKLTGYEKINFPPPPPSHF